MKRQLTITTEPIDEPALIGKRSMSEDMGAVVCFLGVVRETEQGKTITAIEYEAFQRMAEHQFETIFLEMESRWNASYSMAVMVLPCSVSRTTPKKHTTAP